MTVNGKAMAAGPTNATYNRFAGQSLERVAALSDGLFAMTLLVLNLHVPVSGAIHDEHDLWHVLSKLSPNLITYFMTFLTLGIFWIGQQTQLNLFVRSDRNLERSTRAAPCYVVSTRT